MEFYFNKTLTYSHTMTYTVHRIWIWNCSSWSRINNFRQIKSCSMWWYWKYVPSTDGHRWSDHFFIVLIVWPFVFNLYYIINYFNNSGLTARWGAQLGKGMKAEDTLWAGLTDSYAKIPMGITAENLGMYELFCLLLCYLALHYFEYLYDVAEKYNISREESDAFSLRSQQLWGKAHDAGIFKNEIGDKSFLTMNIMLMIRFIPLFVLLSLNFVFITKISTCDSSKQSQLRWKVARDQLLLTPMSTHVHRHKLPI